MSVAHFVSCLTPKMLEANMYNGLFEYFLACKLAQMGIQTL